jgi:hypothetical protein
MLSEAMTCASGEGILKDDINRFRKLMDEKGIKETNVLDASNIKAHSLIDLFTRSMLQRLALTYRHDSHQNDQGTLTMLNN